MHFPRTLSLFLALGSLISASPALAQDDPTRDQSVFGFVGRFHTGHMEHILNPTGPLNLDYENNFVLGGGYQQFYLEPWEDVRFGWEAGVALRGGDDPVSGEVWAGLVGRYDGWRIGDVNISPSVTFGLSAITDTIGIETDRVAEGANPHLLFYIAPEISASIGENAQTEVFFRVQHRSGAWGQLGQMGDGHNANAIGVRYKF
jgi:hypothetical protein